jgi:hypothetical protein
MFVSRERRLRPFRSGYMPSSSPRRRRRGATRRWHSRGVPLGKRRSHVQRRQHDLRAAPDGGEVRGGGFGSVEARSAEQAARGAPAGAVAPVHDLRKARFALGIARLHPEDVTCRLRRSGAGLAPLQLHLQRARQRHRGRAGHKALSDASATVFIKNCFIIIGGLLGVASRRRSPHVTFCPAQSAGGRWPRPSRGGEQGASRRG